VNAKSKLNIFVDSGAFTAFTQGEKIDINEYISFLKENEKEILMAANLDVIGGTEETQKQTQINQEIINNANLNIKVLPCFHYGEDFSILKLYVEKYEYIALGGMAKMTKTDTESVHNWLIKCFDIICNEKGYPKVKVHGFGITTISLMFAYPWESVDSVRPILVAGFGDIMIATKKENKWDFLNNRIVHMAYMEENSKKINSSDRFFYYHLLPKDSLLKKEIDEYFDTFFPKKYTRMGISEYINVPSNHIKKENERWIVPNKKIEIIKEAGLANHYMYRRRINFFYFRKISEYLTQNPSVFVRKPKKFGFF